MRGAAKKFGGRWKIDPERADAILGKDLDPGQLKKATDALPTGGDGVGKINFHDAKAQKEYYQAQLKKIELRKKQGELVDADEIKRSAFECARSVRDSLLGIPDRLSAVLAAETDEFKTRELLRTEITAALSRLVDAKTKKSS